MSNHSRQILIDKLAEIEKNGRVPSDEERIALFWEAVKLANNPGRLTVHGHEFCIQEKSTAEREDWRKEEDGLNARESLESIVSEKDHPFMKEAKLDTWQKRLMYFLKPVARHFGVDDESLLERYLRHNAASHALEMGLDPIPFIPLAWGGKETNESQSEKG